MSLTDQPILRKASAPHGGRVYDAARRWAISPGEVMDFSANINPLGPPDRVLAAVTGSLTSVSLRLYPDAGDLLTILAGKHQVSTNEVLIGNGTAALIFAVQRAVLPSRVLLLAPAFSEYERACLAVKAQVTHWALREEDGFTPQFAGIVKALDERLFDLVILNSPHNPTGAVYSTKDLLAVVAAAEANSVVVILDEAFIDYAPQATLLPFLPGKNSLVILRSLTKFYAIPGLRVGYGVCSAPLAAAIREQVEAWPVSTAALAAAAAALVDDEFETESRRVNQQARDEFSDCLRRIGLHIFPSAANFLLVRLPHSSGSELASWLEPHRILIRTCESFKGLDDAYLRLAVLKPNENARLASLIEDFLKEKNSAREGQE